MKYVPLVGRILFSMIFLIQSLEHFSPNLISQASEMGVPMASLLVPFSGILAFLGGLSILLGYRAKIGAWILVLFLLPISFSMHQFWQERDPFAAMMHHYCFWKNISMLGAALMITYFGSGPCSLKK